MSACLTGMNSLRISTVRPKPLIHSLPRTQVRHATLIRRPKRPYTFTQLVTLSDGSSYMHRTTSPQPVYVSTKDARNTALWNPSSQKLLNVESDEAGRLKAFRDKFGRGWDSKVDTGTDDEGTSDNFMDLITERDRGSGGSKTAAKGTTKKVKGT